MPPRSRFVQLPPPSEWDNPNGSLSEALQQWENGERQDEPPDDFPQELRDRQIEFGRNGLPIVNQSARRTEHPDELDYLLGGLPRIKAISLEDLLKQRNKLVANIFRDYNLLGKILDRHECTIQKRWMKKSKEQKRKILLSAWEMNMPVPHNPDYQLYKFQQDLLEEHSCLPQELDVRQVFIWPFINQENLTKPKTLLFFLNSRGHNPPSHFAAADLEAMHLGIVSIALQPRKLDDYVMILTGRETQDRYGELVHFDDHPDAEDWYVTSRHPDPGSGLLVLESQERTMKFLLACTKQILHDMQETQLLVAPVQPNCLPPSESEMGFASLAIMAAERPYRVPSRLDMSRIESLLAATRDAAEDHMWSMREDPSYFANQMTESFNHRQDLVRDKSGERHPLFKARREDLLWGRVLCDETTIAFIRLEEWDSLHKQAIQLRELHQRFAGELDPEKDLPEEFLYAILRFHHDLEGFAQGPIGELKVSLIASAPWRSYFTRQRESDPAAVGNVVETSVPALKQLGYVKAQFLLLLENLWGDGEMTQITKLTNLLDELQRMSDDTSEVRTSITAFCARQIGDLSIIGECLRQLESFQPWATMYRELAITRAKKIEEDFDRRAEPWVRLFDATKGSNDVLARYGTPDGSRFYYPVNKRRTKENVEILREAERNLDAYWKKVDELVHRNAGDLTGTATRQLMLQPRILQRTPEWVEQEKSKDENVSPSAGEEAYKPLSEIYFDLESRTERTTATTSQVIGARSKAKTRGVPSVEPAPVAEQEAMTEANAADPQPTFAVDHRALKVFRTLFYTPSAGATPGDVAWTDFLHAMVETGFRAEKLYGSVWQFSPSKLDVERSIQFHEPHPSGKIPYWIARRHGRRLHRAYGWFSGMFELSKK